MRNTVDGDAIPTTLRPYIRGLRSGCLILLTHVLNATNTWLVLRYLDAQLPRHGSRANVADRSNNDAESSFVVFASFLRSWNFWQEGSRRLGRDLLKSRQAGDLVYIDGLTSLFMEQPQEDDSAKMAEGFLCPTDLTASGLEKLLGQSIEAGRRSRPDKSITIIIDGLDFLLASQTVDTSALQNLIGYLRSAECSVVLSMSADTPLVHSLKTPLEQDHVALLTSLAHQARYTLSTRLLSTGAAKDVSGVVRITRGSENVDEKELLYYVSGDGSVNVFERGSDSAS